MKKSIMLIILGVVLLSGYLFLTDDNFRNIFNAKREVENMTSQEGGHGGHMPVVQSHRSYELELVSELDKVSPNKPVKIIYKIKNDLGEVLKNYQVTHEKIMHFITVRKDLQYFQHLHPEFNKSTGEFSVDMTFQADGEYRFFPDFMSGQDNPMNLPVTLTHDLKVGDLNKYKPQEVTPDAEVTKTFNDYQVDFIFPNDLKSQTENNYSLDVSKNGSPVTDLEKYLGALGHSVIIKEGTLDFIHTHAIEDNQATGSKIDFGTYIPESGVYKIFTQFQHDGKVVTTDYTIEVT